MREKLSELKEHPGFFPLAFSRFISNVGNGLSPIALAYGVLALPGATGKDLSFVMAARMVPMVALMIFGGVIGDRFKRNRIVGGADILGSVFAAISAIALITGSATVGLLALMGALFGVLNALWWPAMSGVLPEILPKEKLQDGNAIISLLSNIGFVFGALLGGTLVASFGAGWALLVDAISFTIAGFIVWNLELAVIVKDKSTSMFHELKEGWIEFSSRSWVVAMVVAFSVINLAFESLLQVLGPLNYNSSSNGPKYWSYNLAALTVGMFLGSVISLKVKFKRPLYIAMIFISLSAIWDFSLAFQAPLFITFMVIWNTSLQSHVPEAAYSRVVAYDALGSYGIAPIGVAIAGPMAHYFGVSTMILITGSITLTAAVLSLFVKSVRDLRN